MDAGIDVTLAVILVSLLVGWLLAELPDKIDNPDCECDCNEHQARR